MKEKISWEQMEAIIENLEQQELIQTPPDFEKKVMARIEERSREQKKGSRFSETTVRFFYQMKIAGAMVASLLFLVPSGHQLSVGYEAMRQSEWTNKIWQGTSRINADLDRFSGYIIKQITEVIDNEK